MSTNQTERYHLHLWAAEDTFLRSEFNEDNQNTEAALAALAAELDGMRQDLADMSYNVYQSLLQSYYEGKATEHKKALLFDGFLDDSLTAERSDALLRLGRRLVLSRTAQPPMADPYVTTNSALDLREKRICRVYTAQQFCYATGFRFKWRSNTANTTLTLYLQPHVNSAPAGEALSMTVTSDGANQQKEETALFPAPVALMPGDTFWVQFSGPGNLYPICGQSSNDRIGGAVLLDSPTALTGTFTSVTRTLNDGFDRARLWVRHKGGRASAKICGQSMEPVDSRETMSLQGDACTETEFQLLWTGSPQANVTLNLSLGEDARMELYDYGAAFF